MSSHAPRTLAEQLRAWPEERVARLLELRPDLAQPAPQDSAQLAARVGTRSSVVRAVDRLTLLELAVLDAVVLHEGRVSLPRLLQVVHASEEAVADATARLRDAALLWGTEQDLRALSTLRDVVGTALSGLGERLGQLPRGADVDDVLAERGGRTTTRPVDEPPELVTASRTARIVDQAGAGAAAEIVRLVADLLESWGSPTPGPPGVLRSGGLSVRDHRATARALGLEEDLAALVVETAAAAGLLAEGTDGDGDPAWLPTDAYDGWRRLDVAEAWGRLAAAWLGSPRLRGAVGRDRKPHHVLAPGSERAWLVDVRREVLEEVMTLGPTEGLDGEAGEQSLLERVRWRRPRRPPGRTQAVAVTWTDLAAYGVVGLGAPTSFGRTLVDEGPEAAAHVLAPLLPEPVDHVLLQADLTAVAPGPLEHDLADAIAAVADVESRGAATTYRFTASSVRRAMDVGWAAADVHELLRTRSRTPVPQALTYLVDDVARRFGTLRVGVAAAFLRSDDEAALAALVNDPRASSWGLRLLAPTVVVSDTTVPVLLPRLRELGLAPVVESPDGTVRLARPDALRARTPRPRRPAEVRTRPGDPASLAVAATRALRAGDAAAASRPADATGTRLTPTEVVTALREATEAASTVWIQYVDADGRTRELVIEPRRVGDGIVSALDHRSDRMRDFSLHRISAVRSVEA
ncbi:helicase-associated domain-containing protein [Nocardioidaceae bacterium]|nr:helicase-associated domain-containing protein [Nocardioidaceae bacterium]